MEKKYSLKDLRILYLIKTMDVGGAERFCFNLCRHFSQIAGETTVFSSGGLFEKELQQHGVKIITDKHARLTGPLDILKLRSILKEIIKNGEYNIIHCQHRVFVPIIKSLRLKNSNIVYTANNFFNDKFQKLLFPDIAVAISPIIEKNLLNTLSINKNRIQRINYGVDIPKTNTCSENKTVLTIGYIGRLIKEKGIFKLLNAARLLDKGKIKFNMIIKGSGDCQAEINQFIIDHFPMGNVVLKEPESELNSLYKDIDILVLATDMNEGLPISILEALARGIVVIASDKGAISDIIKDRNTGFLIHDTSIEGLTKQISYIIENFHNMDIIKVNSFLQLKSNFNMCNMVNQYEKLYHNCLQ